MAHIFKIISLLFITLQVSARVQTPFGMMYKSPITVKNFGSYRAWSNGTNATTCDGYRNPSGGSSYVGSNTSGIYRITLNGSNADVYCLMDRNSNGYVMVARVPPGATAVVIDSNYSNTLPFMSVNIMKFYRTGKPIWVTFFNGTCNGSSLSGWTSEAVTTIGSSFNTVSGTQTSLGNAFDIPYEAQLVFDTNNTNTIIRRAEPAVFENIQYDNGNRVLFKQGRGNCASSDYLEIYVR